MHYTITREQIERAYADRLITACEMGELLAAHGYSAQPQSAPLLQKAS